MAGARYVELHAHSAYSFLDGASSPEELAAAASVHGYPAVALTDHEGLWGSMEFAHACKGLGVKAITGTELTVAGRHLTLLVENRAGYRNLCRLVTAAHEGTRVYRRQTADGRLQTARDPGVSLEQLERHSEGLVCLTGCARDGMLALPAANGDLAQIESL